MSITNCGNTEQVRQWLKQIKKIAKRKRDLQHEKDLALESRGITTITRQPQKKLARRTPDRADGSIIAYCDFTRELDVSIAECEKELRVARKHFAKVQNWVHRVLLIEHYTENKYLYDIGSDFGKSERSMTREHARAITKLGEILENEKN